jgi:hypothetical protein
LLGPHVPLLARRANAGSRSQPAFSPGAVAVFAVFAANYQRQAAEARRNARPQGVWTTKKQQKNSGKEGNNREKQRMPARDRYRQQLHRITQPKI